MPEISKPSGINKPWARTGNKDEPSDIKKDQGFGKEIPTCEQHNFLWNRSDTAIAHINQHGIAVWDSQTEYQGNKSLTMGSNGNIYRCKVTNTNQNPVTDTGNLYWELWFEIEQPSKLSVNLSLNNSWVNLTGTASARVVSGVLFVRGNLTSGTTANDTTVATLPAGYRPSGTRFIPSVFQTGVYTYSPCVLVIGTDGTVKIRGVTSSADLHINISVSL